MYCPNCGESSPEDRKFCKYCGTNLSIVSQALARGAVPPKSLSETTAKVLEDWFGKDPAPPPGEKRLNAIRGGVITACVGLSASAFLNILMAAIASSPAVDPAAVPILQAVWVVGMIPLFVGLGLIINGIFFYKPLKRPTRSGQDQLGSIAAPQMQREFPDPGVQVPPSVTEQTTHRLETPIPRRAEREGEPG